MNFLLFFLWLCFVIFVFFLRTVFHVRYFRGWRQMWPGNYMLAMPSSVWMPRYRGSVWGILDSCTDNLKGWLNPQHPRCSWWWGERWWIEGEGRRCWWCWSRLWSGLAGGDSRRCCAGVEEYRRPSSATSFQLISCFFFFLKIFLDFFSKLFSEKGRERSKHTTFSPFQAIILAFFGPCMTLIGSRTQFLVIVGEFLFRKRGGVAPLAKKSSK